MIFVTIHVGTTLHRRAGDVKIVCGNRVNSAGTRERACDEEKNGMIREYLILGSNMCLSYVFHGRFFFSLPLDTCDGNHLSRLAFFLVTVKPGFLGTGVVQQPEQAFLDLFERFVVRE